MSEYSPYSNRKSDNLPRWKPNKRLSQHARTEAVMSEVSDTVQSLRQHAENIEQGCSPVNSTLPKRLKNAADLLARTEAERAELENDRTEILSQARQALARLRDSNPGIADLLLCEILCPIDGQGELYPDRLHTEASSGCQEATKAAYTKSIKDMDEDYDMEFDADGEVITTGDTNDN